jgi:hypothetical protein
MSDINEHVVCVSKKTAKALKELGFDWNCLYYYDLLFKHDKVRKNFGETNHNKFENFYSAPTLEMAQKYLREVHKKYISIFSSSRALIFKMQWKEFWSYRITEPLQKLEEGVYGEDFETYEEAQENAIYVTIFNILAENMLKNVENVQEK